MPQLKRFWIGHQVAKQLPGELKSGYARYRRVCSISRVVGARPNVFDPLTPLIDWVEKNGEPKRIVAAHFQDNDPSTGAMRSVLSETSKEMYVDFSDKFIRWLYGDYKPGTYRIMDRRPPRSEN